MDRRHGTHYACHGCAGLPGPLCVATNYLSVVFKLAAEKGAEFAIAYDRNLRPHLKREAVAVEDIAPFFNTLDNARGAALQRNVDREKAERVEKARPSAPAAGGKGGGKGGNNNPSGRDRARNQDRGQDRNRNCSRNENHDR